MTFADVRFPVPSFTSKGRNGFINTSGLTIQTVDRCLFLHPITSRGSTSDACRIALPRDRATLIEIVDKLLQAAE